MDDNEQNSIDRALGLRPIESIEDAEIVESDEDKAIMPAVAEEIKVPAVKVEPGEDETFDDIEQARQNIKSIIEQGGDSLKDMIALAKQSESPRGYEVASTMMKTLLDANRDFVDISMKKKYHREEIETPKEAAQTNITNNNLILSTKELLEMIRGAEPGEKS